jgi:hypothetical protein
VADNGPGLDDTFEWVELQTGEPGLVGDPLPGPADCSSFPPGAQILPLSQNSPFSAGDIVVTDAQPPVPTTIAQCKHGGWLRFGFKNLGRCVAFVIQTRVCEALERHGIHLRICPPTGSRFGRKAATRRASWLQQPRLVRDSVCVGLSGS